MRADDLVARGVPHEEAEEIARRRLGDRAALVESARRRNRELRHSDSFDGLRHDLIVTWRRAAAAPGPTLLTLLTFAIGIGLTTAGYTVVDRVLFRPLAFPRPEELVELENMNEARETLPYVAAATWRVWKENAATLGASALHDVADLTVSLPDGSLLAKGQRVAGDFFRVFEVPMLYGRPFSGEEVERGERVAVVSSGFWRRALGADPDLPLAISIDGSEVRVVGVLAEEVAFPAGTEVWLGDRPADWRSGEAHTWINWHAVARLATGVSPETASAELTAISRGILEQHPEAIYAFGARARPLRDHLVGSARPRLLLLAGAVGFVLLVACANLAGLGFARSSVRAREMGIRTALGAGRPRLIRQLLTEQVVLALAGSILGILLAAWLTGALSRFGGGWIPRIREVAMDGRTLLITLGIAVLTGLVAGILPALRTSRMAPAAAIGGAKGTVSGGRRLPGASLVTAEVALALLLLTGGSLLIRSFQALIARDLGFRPEAIVTASIRLSEERYEDPDQRISFWEELRARAERIPGISDVAFAVWAPASGGGRGFIEFPDRHQGEMVGAGYNVVSDGFLGLLGLRLVSGRGFEPADTAGGPRVVVVNEAMARRYWPGEDLLGKQVKAVSMEIMEGAPWLTVVGVVSDMRQYGYDSEPEAEMYVLYRQVPSWSGSMTLAVRTVDGMPAGAVIPSLRDELKEVDPDLASDIGILSEDVNELLAERRLVMALLSAFALTALLLTAVGLYGLLSFAVARRTREIGLRVALGARQAGVVRLMAGSASRVVAVGAITGVAAALALTRVMRALLVDMTPHDPLSFLLAALVLLAATAAAILVPVVRAVRVDPMEALRVE
jgi:putative ABC transport system permease protein